MLLPAEGALTRRSDTRESSRRAATSAREAAPRNLIARRFVRDADVRTGGPEAALESCRSTRTMSSSSARNRYRDRPGSEWASYPSAQARHRAAPVILSALRQCQANPSVMSGCEKPGTVIHRKSHRSECCRRGKDVDRVVPRIGRQGRTRLSDPLPWSSSRRANSWRLSSRTRRRETPSVPASSWSAWPASALPTSIRVVFASIVILRAVSPAHLKGRRDDTVTPPFRGGSRSNGPNKWCAAEVRGHRTML
jgi:hypothetical protein